MFGFLKSINWKKITLFLFCFVQISIASTSNDELDGWVNVDSATIPAFVSQIASPKVAYEYKSKHASTGAVSLEIIIEEGTKSIQETGKRHYQAKGSGKIPSTDSDNAACRHAHSVKGSPRLHSEIAYLQDLTALGDPIKTKQIAGHPLSEILEIKIYIKNSGRWPCFQAEYPNDHGTSCRTYLKQFCDSIYNQTNKNGENIKCTVYVHAPKFGWTCYSRK